MIFLSRCDFESGEFLSVDLRVILWSGNKYGRFVKGKSIFKRGGWKGTPLFAYPFNIVHSYYFNYCHIKNPNSYHKIP